MATAEAVVVDSVGKTLPAIVEFVDCREARERVTRLTGVR